METLINEVNVNGAFKRSIGNQVKPTYQNEEEVKMRNLRELIEFWMSDIMLSFCDDDFQP